MEEVISLAFLQKARAEAKHIQHNLGLCQSHVQFQRAAITLYLGQGLGQIWSVDCFCDQVAKNGFYISRVVKKQQPWPVWLSKMSAGLLTKRLLVQFLVRAHAWVAGQVLSWGCARGNRCIFSSHQMFLPPQ